MIARRATVFASFRRRRGIAAIYTAALMIFMLMIASMVIDMGYLYRQRSECQRAADAAALAGAWQLAHFSAQADADKDARKYAGLPENGSYVNGVNGCIIRLDYPAGEVDANGNTILDKDGKAITFPNWYRVTIWRPERTFFALASSSKSKYTISATSVALYETNAPLVINGLGTYGATNNSVNLCAFGPDARYDYGDCYSTTKLMNGNLNPNYKPNGYDFLATVPKGTVNPEFDVMDPDCYDDIGQDSDFVNGKIEYDQYRAPDGSTTATFNGVSTLDNTLYTVYDDNGTPNPNDDVALGAIKCDGNSCTSKAGDPNASGTWAPYMTASAANSNWVPIWTDTRSSRSQPNSNYRINVKTLSGSSNNGYNLRCGPQLTGSQTFDPKNGTSISADGRICLNFFQSGTVDVTLGSIPTEAAGGNLTINKFDTDVTAPGVPNNIYYTCSSIPGTNFPGTLAGNGAFAADVLSLPKTYTTGTWIAHYTAGHADTSCWNMSYSNSGPGSPGNIRLVR